METGLKEFEQNYMYTHYTSDTLDSQLDPDRL